MADEKTVALLEYTADVVSAYVARNTIAVADLPNFIVTVQNEFEKLGSASGRATIFVTPKPVPAVNPKKSVTDDYIICLEDGKKFKSLKRHLNALRMTPDEYRKKWDLSSDYPLVARNYALARSKLAKNIGLGRQQKSNLRIKSDR